MKFLFLIFFNLVPVSLFAEISNEKMAEKFTQFKTSPAAAQTTCAKSVLFLDQITRDFRTELHEARKAEKIQMMEKILYTGGGVGGFSGRDCNPTEYAIMTEAAVILELWHKRKGTRQYFIHKNLNHENAKVLMHYNSLKYISLAVDKISDGTLKTAFFKDAINDIVTDIKKTELDFTERKLLETPAMRQIDVLVANLLSSPGFIDVAHSIPDDYQSLPTDDGLNAIRIDMHNLMDTNTISEAISLIDSIEDKCWNLAPFVFETEAAKNLIRKAIAAVERIKSVRFDNKYMRKDPRPAEDKFKDISVSADAKTKKKNTILLLMSIAMQERYANMLNSPDDIKKIILAKLQQSNYWEGGDALLAGKTDLQAYPIDLPGYADDVIQGIAAFGNVIPKVYPRFVYQIEERAVANKGSPCSTVGVHYVGGNRFLHMASSGAACQCGFFSFGLMDDGAHNARQKFFDIFSNSLDINTIRDVGKMTSVLEVIGLYAEGKEEDFKLLKIITKTGERYKPGEPGKKESIYTIGGYYPGAEVLTNAIKTLDKNTILRKLAKEDATYQNKRLALARELGLVEINNSLRFDDEDPRRIGFETLQRDYDYKKSLICATALRELLSTNPAARTAFSSYAKHVLAGKLLQEEKSVGIVDYLDINQQLLFRPGNYRYQSVKDLDILAAAVSPTQTLAQVLNTNVQVISASGQFAGTYGQLIYYQEPSRAFSSSYYVLQDIHVSPTAKNQLLINFGGGHYEKLIPLSDTVALAKALRHLVWKGMVVPELK